MKKFDSTGKNIAYLGYRLVNQVFDPIRFIKGIWGYAWYIRDFILFKMKNPHEKIRFVDLYPQLHDKTSMTGLDAHYFYQQLWLFENVLKNKPKEHVDVGSTYQMSGYLSKIVPTTFIDIRPIDANLENLKVLDASILDLPYPDNSLESISCLHVIEHVGLGRYGDEIDPDGWKKSCKELQRVLAKGGRLYLSTPIGNSRICFNAHRIFDPDSMIKAFNGFELKEFSFIDDTGNLNSKVSASKALEQSYACGLYLFEKL